MSELTRRQHEILVQVIESHIESAEPVGSRHLAESLQRPYCPATVRHEMGGLEELGYLSHMHTSSGRIPTDKGYRYYVDHGLAEEVFSTHPFMVCMNRVKEDEEENLESYAERISFILAMLSQEVGLIILGSQGDATEREKESFKILLKGTTSLFDKPEFKDTYKMKLLFEVLEEKNRLAKWISEKTQSSGVSVSIGRENKLESLRDCSVVSAKYTAGNSEGTIALVGPTRMRYARALPLVLKASDMIHQVIDWWERN